MRFRLMMVLAIALLMAGCGNQPAATTAPTEAAAATENPTQGVVIVTRVPGTELAPGELPVGGVGTLVASETEDPNAGKPFDSIQLRQISGLETPEVIEININADGSFTRNGQAGVLSPERVQQIIDLIDRVNFFGMQGTMTGPASGANQYALTITRAGVSRTIASMDGFMPTLYIQLIGVIFETGLRP